MAFCCERLVVVVEGTEKGCSLLSTYIGELFFIHNNDSV